MRQRLLIRRVVAVMRLNLKKHWHGECRIRRRLKSPVMRLGVDTGRQQQTEIQNMQTASTTRERAVPPLAIRRGQELPGQASQDVRMEFVNIVSHRLPQFRKVAMRWLRNPEDAEDAVQDAMLSAYKNIGAFNGRAQLSTWITAIVINSVRMQIRRRPRCQVLSLDHCPEYGKPGISESLADPGPTPEQTLERSELRNLIAKMSRSLPDSQRAALRLHLGDGLSIREVAGTLGVPEGTVKAQLARGRAALTRRFHQAAKKRTPESPAAHARAKRRDDCSGHGPDPEWCEVSALMPVFQGQQGQQGGYEAWAGA
jgi:RNA polymerase sigma-70 factor, ECF subfamily